MSSQYLNCDHCQATLKAEAVTGQRPSTFSDPPDLVAYAKQLGWSIQPGLDLCPKCVRFTYDDEDEKRILESITDPVKRRLVELIFSYASQCGGLYEKDFNEIQELAQ